MVTEVQGHGQQGGVKYQWRGEKYEVDLLPKVSIEIVVKDEDVDRIVKAIITSARTGEDKGEGKIFVYNIERAIRIRTGEEGDGAI
jgi:nitrogen regulatory protein P-II 1